ncbi:hypothetical protein CL656_07050 [bacterium]|nr:hypothetical protein [bacterium]|tara:strand:+ start:2647 stop:2892 length:246 start_codon:yes stop_codon:yes gene_type:complete
MLSFCFQHYKVQSAIFIFLILYISLIVLEPNFCFDDDGNILQFGLNYKNKTIIPIWLMAIVIGILSYFFIYYYLHMKTVMF